MKQTISFNHLFLISISIQAQSSLCGTPDTPITQSDKESIDQSKMMEGEVCVNIRFHILQDYSGDIATEASHIDLILEDLNDLITNI